MSFDPFQMWSGYQLAQDSQHIMLLLQQGRASAPSQITDPKDSILPYYGDSGPAHLRAQARAFGLTDELDCLRPDLAHRPLLSPQTVMELMQEELFLPLNGRNIALTFMEVLQLFVKEKESSIHIINLQDVLGDTWISEAMPWLQVPPRKKDSVEVAIYLAEKDFSEVKQNSDLLAKRYLLDCIPFKYTFKKSEKELICHGFRALMKLPLQQIHSITIPAGAGLAEKKNVAPSGPSQHNGNLEGFCDAWFQEMYEGQVYDLLKAELGKANRFQFYNLKGEPFKFAIHRGAYAPAFVCKGPLLNLRPWLEGKELTFQGTVQSFFDRECQLIRLTDLPADVQTFISCSILITAGFHCISTEDEQKLQKALRKLSIEELCKLFDQQLTEQVQNFNFAFLFNALNALPLSETDLAKIWRHFHHIKPDSPPSFIAIHQVIHSSNFDSQLARASVELYAFSLYTQPIEKRQTYLLEHQGRFIMRWHGLQIDFNPVKSLQILLERFPKNLPDENPFKQLLGLCSLHSLEATSPLLVHAKELKFEKTQLIEPLLRGISHESADVRQMCHAWLLSLFPVSEHFREDIIRRLPAGLEAEPILNRRQRFATELSEALGFNLRLTSSTDEESLVLALADSSDGFLHSLSLDIWEKSERKLHMAASLADVYKKRAPLHFFRMLKKGAFEKEHEAQILEVARLSYANPIVRFSVVCEIADLLNQASLPLIFQVMDAFFLRGDLDSVSQFAQSCEGKGFLSDGTILSSLDFLQSDKKPTANQVKMAFKSWIEADLEVQSKVYFHCFWQAVSRFDNEVIKEIIKKALVATIRKNPLKIQPLIQELVSRKMLKDNPDYKFALLFNYCNAFKEKSARMSQVFAGIVPATPVLRSLQTAITFQRLSWDQIQAFMELQSLRLLVQQNAGASLNHTERGAIIQWQSLQFPVRPAESLKMILSWPLERSTDREGYLNLLSEQMPPLQQEIASLPFSAKELHFEDEEVVDLLLKGTSHANSSVRFLCKDLLYLMERFSNATIQQKIKAEREKGSISGRRSLRVATSTKPTELVQQILRKVPEEGSRLMVLGQRLLKFSMKSNISKVGPVILKRAMKAIDIENVDLLVSQAVTLGFLVSVKGETEHLINIKTIEDFIGKKCPGLSLSTVPSLAPSTKEQEAKQFEDSLFYFIQRLQKHYIKNTIGTIRFSSLGQQMREDFVYHDKREFQKLLKRASERHLVKNQGTKELIELVLDKNAISDFLQLKCEEKSSAVKGSTLAVKPDDSNYFFFVFVQLLLKRYVHDRTPQVQVQLSTLEQQMRDECVFQTKEELERLVAYAVELGLGALQVNQGGRTLILFGENIKEFIFLNYLYLDVGSITAHPKPIDAIKAASDPKTILTPPRLEPPATATPWIRIPSRIKLEPPASSPQLKPATPATTPPPANVKQVKILARAIPASDTQTTTAATPPPTSSPQLKPATPATTPPPANVKQVKILARAIPASDTQTTTAATPPPTSSPQLKPATPATTPPPASTPEQIKPPITAATPPPTSSPQLKPATPATTPPPANVKQVKILARAIPASDTQTTTAATPPPTSSPQLKPATPATTPPPASTPEQVKPPITAATPPPTSSPQLKPATPATTPPPANVKQVKILARAIPASDTQTTTAATPPPTSSPQLKPATPATTPPPASTPEQVKPPITTTTPPPTSSPQLKPATPATTPPPASTPEQVKSPITTTTPPPTSAPQLKPATQATTPPPASTPEQVKSPITTTTPPPASAPQLKPTTQAADQKLTSTPEHGKSPITTTTPPPASAPQLKPTTQAADQKLTSTPEHGKSPITTTTPPPACAPQLKPTTQAADQKLTSTPEQGKSPITPKQVVEVMKEGAAVSKWKEFFATKLFDKLPKSWVQQRPDLVKEASPLQLLQLLKQFPINRRTTELLILEIAAFSPPDLSVLKAVVALLSHHSEITFKLLDLFFAEGNGLIFASECVEKGILTDEAIIFSLQPSKKVAALEKLFESWRDSEEALIAKVYLHFIKNLFDKSENSAREEFCTTWLKMAVAGEPSRVPALLKEPLYRNHLKSGPTTALLLLDCALKLDIEGALKVYETAQEACWLDKDYQEHFEKFLDLYLHLEGEQKLGERLIKGCQAAENLKVLLRKFLKLTNGVNKEKRKQFSEGVAGQLHQQLNVPLEKCAVLTQANSFETLLVAMVETRVAVLKNAAIDIWKDLERKTKAARAEALLRALKNLSEGIDGPLFDLFFEVYRVNPNQGLRTILHSIKPDHPELLKEERLARIEGFDVKDLSSFQALLELALPENENESKIVRRKVKAFLPIFWNGNKIQNAHWDQLKVLQQKYPDVSIESCLQAFPIRTAEGSDLVRYSQLLQAQANASKFAGEATLVIRRCTAPDKLETALELFTHFPVKDSDLRIEVLQKTRRTGNLMALTKALKMAQPQSSPLLESERLKLLVDLAALDAKWQSEILLHLKRVEESQDQKALERTLETLLESPEKVTSLFEPLSAARARIPRKMFKLDLKLVKCALCTRNIDGVKTGSDRLLELLKSGRKFEVFQDLLALLKANPSLTHILETVQKFGDSSSHDLSIWEKEIELLVANSKERKYSTQNCQTLIFISEQFVGENVVNFHQKQWNSILGLFIDYMTHCSPKGGEEDVYLFPIAWRYFLSAKLKFLNETTRISFEDREKQLVPFAEKWNISLLDALSKSELMGVWHCYQLTFLLLSLYSTPDNLPELNTVPVKLPRLHAMCLEMMQHLITKLDQSASLGPIPEEKHPEDSFLAPPSGSIPVLMVDRKIEAPHQSFEQTCKEFWDVAFEICVAKENFEGIYNSLFNWARVCKKRFREHSDFYVLHFDYILDLMTCGIAPNDIFWKKKRAPYLLKLLEMVPAGSSEAKIVSERVTDKINTLFAGEPALLRKAKEICAKLE